MAIQWSREYRKEAVADTDKCSEHDLINFRPGKPHTLTVEKRKVEASVIIADASNKYVRTTDDGENVRNSPEDGSVDSEFDQLKQASAVNNDD